MALGCDRQEAEREEEEEKEKDTQGGSRTVRVPKIRMGLVVLTFTLIYTRLETLP